MGPPPQAPPQVYVLVPRLLPRFLSHAVCEYATKAGEEPGNEASYTQRLMQYSCMLVRCFLLGLSLFTKCGPSLVPRLLSLLPHGIGNEASADPLLELLLYVLDYAVLASLAGCSGSVCWLCGLCMLRGTLCIGGDEWNASC